MKSVSVFLALIEANFNVVNLTMKNSRRKVWEILLVISLKRNELFQKPCE
jgi:hypothetical protein